MGGKVLEHEAKTILRQGIEQGRTEGIEQGRTEGIEQGTLNDLKSLIHNLHMTAEQAMDVLDVQGNDRKKYLELLH